MFPKVLSGAGYRLLFQKTKNQVRCEVSQVDPRTFQHKNKRMPTNFPSSWLVAKPLLKPNKYVTDFFIGFNI
jgi:hypothetical protein